MTTGAEVTDAVEVVIRDGSERVSSELVARIVAADLERRGHEAKIRANGEGWWTVVLGPFSDDAA